jgi:hypothetical protein
MSLIGLRAAAHVYDSIPGSGEIIPEELPGLQRARPFYFEDSQVVLQASHSITVLPSAL